jgi:ribulose-phosphate 3-epimerase
MSSMNRSDCLAELRSAPPAVLPSLLLCDFANLEREIRALEAAGVRALHLDVMDGHFVPNMTYGLTLVETLRRITDLPLDVHLMISNPSDYLSQYIGAGADLVTFHAEAVDDPRPLLEEIRHLGAGAGLAINPPTSVAEIEPVLPLCDLVLVMSVMPGFGGQTFDEVALEKLDDLRAKVSDQVLLEVDGGVNASTIAACGAAGAQLLVAGSAIFRTEDYASSVAHLTELASSQLERTH